MEVVDESGNPLPDGQAGEFLISGATLMKGYWKRPEETDRVFLRGGYLSGDIGIRHPEGYYVFLERKDDLIIRGGENVYPLEIEKQLYQHPDVREAAVKGIADPVMGCEIKAYVALYEGATPDGASLKDFLSNYLVSYKIPRYIEFRDELPKNSNGKILRRKLP
jgi:long-chain acyl-CoA synthetase